MIPVSSIGCRAAGALEACPRGYVQALFRAACYLLTDNGTLIVLVMPKTGAGPLNLVVQTTAWPDVVVGTTFAVTAGQLNVSPLFLDLAPAAVWEARPDWAATARQEQIWAAIAVCAEATSVAETIGLTCGPDFASHTAAVVTARACNRRDMLELALQALCGLGPGLTPAGDDWLAGWLLGLHLADPRAADHYGKIIVDAARTRTTTLSRAYLGCAAAGQIDAAWSALLDQLSRNPMCENNLYLTTRRIITRGATSGAAMFAGFIAALRPKFEVQPCLA